MAEYHIVGCGDIGCRVALRLMSKDASRAGDGISAWVRSVQSAKRARSMGVDASVIDLDQEYESEQHLDQPNTAHLYYFAPPPKQGQTDTRLRHFLNGLKARPNRIVLISTTGVYGDCNGEWVDESSPTNPTADRAYRRLDAETVLRNWADVSDVEWVILRVPGIYAPDRLPTTNLRLKKPLVQIDQAPWTNRIHADDLAEACVQAMHKDCANQIINISDDQPSTMTEYFLKVAEYAGLDAPKQIPLRQALDPMSDGMRSYMQESRRVRNDKMKQVLDLTLRYPNLRVGLEGYIGL